jgi:kinesin family protein 4/21/27
MFTGAIEPVGVILRIRPFTPFELAQACGRCLDKVKGEPQVSLGEGQKAFTFDQVYDLDAKQVDIYTATVQPLLDSFFAGVNVTILAYGQTGSGKTYTMGTEYSKVVCPDEITEKAGMIPRIVAETFERIEQERIHGTAVSHTVKVSFLEIHKDDIRDLLDSAPKTCTLREDTSGAVLVSGLEEFVVNSSRELLECLGRGSHNRATASTCMNATSSRSHAVFTITMEKTCATSAPVSSSDNTPAGPTCGSMVALDGSTVIARLHLVDLAGSERVNRAHTEGERLKEGISINKGLLALGNVISALSGEGGVGGHVPYRDSKLTRMLQDSLGGNSKTVMIACVSPADNSFEETISTMQYANRAKNIKNKAVVNVSSSNTEIASLRSHIMALEAQLHGTAPAGGNSGGSRGEVMKVDSLCVEVEILKSQRANVCVVQMAIGPDF